MKQYLLLYPDTFLWIDESKGLIYNSLNGYTYNFLLDSDIKIICKYLLDSQNMYIYQLSHKEIENKKVKIWIEEILDIKAGEIVRLEDDNIIPFSFPPIINLQSDIERISSESNRNVYENIISYLHEINIYLGGVCKQPYPIFKQTNYPMSDEKNIIDPKQLYKIIETIKHVSLSVNIIGGDLINYPYYNELFQLLNECVFTLTFFVFDFDFINLQKILSKEESLFFKIIYTEDIYYEQVNQFLLSIKPSLNVTWIFTVSSDKDIEKIEYCINKYPHKNNIYPIYTNNNDQFFQEKVYIDKNFLRRPKISKKQVYRNLSINTNFWGKITILASGHIYSNLNYPSIGTLNDSLYDIILRELKMKNTWRLTRDQHKPCNSCLFKYICPPISNYELILNHFNLCPLKN